MSRTVLAILLTVVVGSGVTAVAVTYVHDRNDNKVVKELQREDRTKKSDEAAAKDWMTHPSVTAGKY